MHEGGFGVERIAGGALQFARPDGQPIIEHPRLPDAHANVRLHNSFFGERGQPIDSANWIIPEGALDLDLAISGLLQFESALTHYDEHSFLPKSGLASSLSKRVQKSYTYGV